MQHVPGVFEALLTGLVGVWTATIVGVGFLAVRFYLREGRGERRVPASRPVSPAEAVQPVGTSALGSGKEEAVDSEGAATLPAGPFVVLPGPREGGRKRRRARRRKARRRRPLVR